MSSWLQEQDISAAWLSLDERDNAFDERINKFNRSMNRGYRLSKWFVKEFGSTQCQAITGCDFSDSSGVSDYIEGDCITKCRKITEKVAERVQQMLADETRRD